MRKNDGIIAILVFTVSYVCGVPSIAYNFLQVVCNIRSLTRNCKPICTDNRRLRLPMTYHPRMSDGVRCRLSSIKKGSRVMWFLLMFKLLSFTLLGRVQSRNSLAPRMRCGGVCCCFLCLHHSR